MPWQCITKVGCLGCKDKILMLTGFPRSATKGTVMFHAEFGIKAFHQRFCAPAHLRLMDYSFKNPPKIVEDYVSYKSSMISGNGFEASWDLGNFIYLLSLKKPEINWLITIRNPKEACNSLTHYRVYKDPVETAAIYYLFHYDRILKQIKLMDEKPKWIDFDAYVGGAYIDSFFSYWDVDKTKYTYKKADRFLSKKINNFGKYRLFDSNNLFKSCEQITDKIKNECAEF